MAKRLTILCALLILALGAGLLGAKMLGGPFISQTPSDHRAQTERYALGRDIYREEDYAVDTRYAPYQPGGKPIAKPSVGGARPIEPYEAARPDHRIGGTDDSGNFLESTDLPRSDYAVIDPPVRSAAQSPPAPAAAEEPQNLLPKGFTRTEEPATHIQPVPSVPRGDPVAETERRIMDMTSGQRRRPTNQDQTPDPASPDRQ